MSTDLRAPSRRPPSGPAAAARRANGRRPRRAWTPRRAIRAVALLVAGVAVGTFSVFPFFWMALTSIKQNQDIVSPSPVFFPTSLRFDRYTDLFAQGFGTYALNSLRLAAVVTILCLGCSALAAYSLARFKIPLRRYLILVILAAQMFPLAILLIPLFIMLRQLNLLNSLPGLVLADLAFTVPLTVAILRGFFAAIPVELDEAAMIDGATRVGALFRVVFPVAAPGIAATSIFAFINTWNEFIFALTFTPGTDMRVLPVALSLLVGRDVADWGSIMAGSTLYTVPIIIFFLFVHRNLMQGMALGAVKG